MRQPTFRRALLALGLIALGVLAYAGAVLFTGSASASKPPPTVNVPGAFLSSSLNCDGSLYPDGGWVSSCESWWAPVQLPDGKKVVGVKVAYDTTLDPNPPNTNPPTVDLVAGTDSGATTTMARATLAQNCAAPCSASTTAITAPAVDNVTDHYWISVTGNWFPGQGAMKVYRVQIQYK